MSTANAYNEVATQRDHHGRLLAPVSINNQGPFALIVDTGANGSAIAPTVADALKIPPEQFAAIRLRGVTGASRADAIAVNFISIGDFRLLGVTLTIVSHALEGADGFFGTGAIGDNRVSIDMRRARLAITHSSQPLGDDRAVKLPFELSASRLVIVQVSVNGEAVSAIIDTGAGGTVGNAALRDRLVGTKSKVASDAIIGTTAHVDYGETVKLPPVAIGPIRILGVRASFAEMSIFAHCELSHKPALLIGMDVIGGFDSLIIDYHLRRLALLPPMRR